MEHKLITSVKQKFTIEDWMYVKAYLIPMGKDNFKNIFIAILIILVCTTFNNHHDFNNLSTYDIVIWAITGILSFILFILYMNINQIILGMVVRNLEDNIFEDIDFYEDYFACKGKEYVIVHYNKIKKVDDLNKIYAIRIKNDRVPIIFINKDTYEARYALSIIKGKVKKDDE